MTTTYEISTEITGKIELDRFISKNMDMVTAMEIMTTLYDNGFKPTDGGMIKGWGSISNNEVIFVSYVMMATLPWPEEKVPCVHYQYHREEWPGYEMIDHREDFEGGSTWEDFKKRFCKKAK